MLVRKKLPYLNLSSNNRMTEGIQETVDNCVETETSIILQDERDQHRERLEQTQFLQKDSETVQKELVDLRDRKKDLCIRRADLKKDVSKISQESLTFIEVRRPFLTTVAEKCYSCDLESIQNLTGDHLVCSTLSYTLTLCCKCVFSPFWDRIWSLLES